MSIHIYVLGDWEGRDRASPKEQYRGTYEMGRQKTTAHQAQRQSNYLDQQLLPFQTLQATEFTKSKDPHSSDKKGSQRMPQPPAC